MITEHDMKCKACGEPLLIGASGLVCSSAKCTSRIIPARMKEARRKFPAACIEHGDEAEVVTRIQCPECKGKKTVDCDECCGSGDCDCPHCGQDMTCEECDGDGRVECPECDGIGFIDP